MTRRPVGAMAPQHEQEAIQETLQWERESGLAAIRWLGVSPWRLVRKRVIVAHLEDRAGRGKSNYNERDAGQALRMIGNALKSVPQLLRVRRCRYLLVNFPRRRLESGEWVDPFVDPLAELLGESCTLCVEKPFAGRHFTPARTRRMLYLDGALLLAGALGRPIGWLLARFSGDSLGRLTRSVAERTGADEHRLRRMIAVAVAEFRVEAALMGLLLRIARPRHVLLTSRWVHAPLIWAARRRGIRVLELQHGALTRGGYAYGTAFDRELDPDLVLTFGPCWNDFEWGVDPHAVVAVGFRYAWLRREQLLESGRRGRKTMLISKPSRHAYLSEIFLELARRHPRREFILRLHPQDVVGWETRYPAAALPNVAVSTEATADLYDTFAECALVVGDESTVLYEAAFFGLTVAILNLEGTNSCPALGFGGQYGFVDVRSGAELDALIEDPPAPAAPGGNPFFAEFDPAHFEALVN